jgi:hypothetical protein
MSLINDFLALPYDEIPSWAAAHAAQLWAIENAMISQVTDWNLGGFMEDIRTETPTVDQMAEFFQRLNYAHATPPKTWRGLDVRHVANQIASNKEYSAVYLFAALHLIKPSQAAFDFLTLKDQDNIRLDCNLLLPDLRGYAGQKEVIAALTNFSDDEFRLASAFCEMMITEAAPYVHQVGTGAYVMPREAFPRLDAEIAYDSLRLIITPEGIAVSVINGDKYIPFVWTPKLCTAIVWVHPRAALGFRMMLACFWRDACVIKEGVTTRTAGRGYQNKTGDNQQGKNKVIFPKVIYKSHWGTPSEREQVEQLARQAHAVRGSYPILSDGRTARAANERAEEYGYPPPPPGHTFRKPHTRGEGAMVATLPVRQVKFRGLQVAKILLS